MQQYLPIIQAVISVLLIVFILLQHKGSALGSAFGGDGNIYKSKRGLEGFLHTGSIVLAVLFLASAVISLLLK